MRLIVDWTHGIYLPLEAWPKVKVLKGSAKKRAVLVFTGLVNIVILLLSTACAQTKSEGQGGRPRRVGSGSARSVTVRSGGNLQAALDAADFGDTIILEAGGIYKAPTDRAFVLPAKKGGSDTEADYITIRTSAIDSLPVGRVSPSDKANMAKIVATGPYGALTGAQGAKWWKLVGIEFVNQSDGSPSQFCHTMIGFSGPQASTVDPSHYGDNITIDRCYIHSQEDGTTNYKRTAAHAIIWNAGSVTITNNWISGWSGVYAHDPSQVIDTVAIGNSAAGGPFYINNNYISATFNPIFLGGGENGSPNVATISAGATSTSATLSQVANLKVGDKIALEVGAVGGDLYACGTVLSISGNTITYTQLVRNEGGERYVASSRTPLAGGKAKWRGFTIHDFTFTRNTVEIDTRAAQWILEHTKSKPKAYAEIKLLEKGLFEGNVFQGWPTGIAITLRNQNGFSPWSNVKDVAIRNNLFKEFSALLICQLFSGDRLSETGSEIELTNNLAFGPIRNSLVGTFPVAFYSSFGQGVPLTVRHNTIINRQDMDGGSMVIGLEPMKGAIIKDNIMYFNTYGAQCGVPGNAFSSCWPELVEGKNVLIGNANVGAEYVTGLRGGFRNSYYSPTEAAVRFTDPVNNDYRLRPDSRYRNAASDGKDVGVDFEALLSALGVTKL